MVSKYQEWIHANDDALSDDVTIRQEQCIWAKAGWKAAKKDTTPIGGEEKVNFSTECPACGNLHIWHDVSVKELMGTKKPQPTGEELITLSKIAEQLEKDIAVFDLSPCLPLDRIMHNIQILKGNQPSEEEKR